MTTIYRLRSAVSLILLLALPASVFAMRVDNFVLLDQNGAAFNLYYEGATADAIVLIVQGNGCPIVRNALADLKAVRQQFADKNVKFAMLNSNLQDNRASIAKEADAWHIDLPVLNDSTQLIGESLGLIRTAEVLVIDPDTWEVVYRGPVNDRLDYERQKKVATAHYAADAINAVLEGNKVEIAKRDGIGCLINFAERNKDHTQISYTEEVAPILQNNCVACHSEGGIGPWAMTDYNMIRGFAPMIREVLRTKRMPPWHADPAVGNWQHDRSLSVEETQTLVHWIEAGAPRGEGEDPLLTHPYVAEEWPLGKPDLIVEIPAFTIPASGVVDYQFPSVPNPLNEPVWVRAATIVPGARDVVHHVLMGASDPGAEIRSDRESVFDNYIIGYAPGNESSLMPEGTGVYIQPGSHFLFQMHYTPVGREAVDRTRVGLYFHKERPNNFLRHQVVLNPTIAIPPNAAKHSETAYFEFDKDAILYGMVPHAHYRGRSSTFELAYPDGKRELLLSVPNYDFNWQRTYEFETPKAVPAGAKLVHTTVYDNSAANPGNPDPSRTVPWGLQSWDEMLYGAFNYAWADETSARPIHDKALSEHYQWVGFLDKDMDGKLVWAELPERMKKQLVQGFKLVDTNGDGGLSAEELYNMRRQQTAGAR